MWLILYTILMIFSQRAQPVQTNALVICKLPTAYCLLRLNVEFHKDIQWWADFLTS